METLTGRIRREAVNLILGVVAVALILNCYFAPKGVRDLVTLRGHRTALEARLKRHAAQNTELRTIVQRLHSDDAYVERRIRSELGYARSDEVVYRFVANDSTSDH
jgi:cell division protein FtsB